MKSRCAEETCVPARLTKDAGPASGAVPLNELGHRASLLVADLAIGMGDAAEQVGEAREMPARAGSS